MTNGDSNDEAKTQRASLIEQHLQTIITAVLLALLLWTGNTLLDIRQKVTTLEVQVQVMQSQLQSGVDDRFRGSDWRREKEILDDRFKRIEAEIDKHRVATERR